VVALMAPYLQVAGEITVQTTVFYTTIFITTITTTSPSHHQRRHQSRHHNHTTGLAGSCRKTSFFLVHRSS